MVEKSDWNICYLPGLGADARLFTKMQPYLAGNVLQLPSPASPDQSLKSYAEVCLQHWEVTHPVCFVGFSFGAMVAKEVCQLLNRKNPEQKTQLIMVSSCRNAHAVDAVFKSRTKYLGLFPDALLRLALVHLGPRFVAKQDNLSKTDYHTLKAMARDTDLAYFRWAARACAKWDNVGRESFPTYQVHGAHDRVIPVPETDPDTMIQDGGHLLCYTHAESLSKIIQTRLQQ